MIVCKCDALRLRASFVCLYVFTLCATATATAMYIDALLSACPCDCASIFPNALTHPISQQPYPKPK